MFHHKMILNSVVWVKIKTLGNNDLYIGSFYKPPGRSDPQYLDKLYSFITRMPTANGAHLWIGGDFNLGDINWEKKQSMNMPLMEHNATSY